MSIYAPNRGIGRTILFKNLGNILKSFTLDEFLDVSGDWNCTLEFLLDRNNEKPYSVSASLKTLLFSMIL